MSGKKRNAMLFVLLFTLLLGVIVPVQAQSYGGTKTIRVAYREDADFINKSSSGVYKGYGVEYLNKISQFPALVAVPTSSVSLSLLYLAYRISPFGISNTGIL